MHPAFTTAGARLMLAFTQQLVEVQNWLGRKPEIPVLAVNCADALEDPAATAARLARFLGQQFDGRAAAAAIDPTLRRRKSVS